MSGPVFPKEGLRALVARLVDTPRANVIYPTEPEPMSAPKDGKIPPLVKLSHPKRSTVGNDQLLRIAKPDGSNREIYGGQRAVKLVVRVESQNGITAEDVLETFLMRAETDGNLQAFRDLDLALADWGDIVPVSNVAKNRTISTALVELSLNWAVELEDANPPGVIEKVASGNPSNPSTAPVVDITGTVIP